MRSTYTAFEKKTLWKVFTIITIEKCFNTWSIFDNVSVIFDTCQNKMLGVSLKASTQNLYIMQQKNWRTRNNCPTCWGRRVFSSLFTDVKQTSSAMEQSGFASFGSFVSERFSLRSFRTSSRSLLIVSLILKILSFARRSSSKTCVVINFHEQSINIMQEIRWGSWELPDNVDWEFL